MYEKLDYYRKKYALGTAVFILAVAFIGAGIYFENREIQEPVAYNIFLEKVHAGEVSSVVLSQNSTIEFYTEEGKFVTDNPRTENFKEFLLKNNVSVKEKNNSDSNIVQYLLSIVVISAVAFTVFKISAKDKSAIKTGEIEAAGSEEDYITFDLVAGNAEAKEQVRDVVDFIKMPEKYQKYGARMPRGVIFYGPPGTGKTLLAKAIAGEAEVPFYAVSGSDFVQMYVGVGALRVREIFKKARSHSKAVIFIDEIDALGKKRSGGTSGGNDERDQTLNALLTEMSGFKGHEGIVIIAATNRLDTLDEALLRPGRFDRHVEIGLPDSNARKDILLLHSMNKPVAEDVDLNIFAQQTVYFSGAMLENLMNESAILAAKENSEKIHKHHLDKAFYTVIAGMEKGDISGRNREEMEITAYHESGHALMTKLRLKGHSVSKISIIPSTKGAGGFCISIPPDRMYCRKKDLEGQIMMLLAGRGAEEIIYGPDYVTTGASNDLERASAIAYDYIGKYAMGEKLSVTSSSEGSADVDEQCEALLRKLYEETLTLLMDNRAILENITKELINKETLNEQELDEIMKAGKAE